MNHKNWGGFDKQESCRSASGGSSSRSVMEKIEPVYRCCGKYPDRFPFQFTTSTGEQRRTGSHFFFNFSTFLNRFLILKKMLPWKNIRPKNARMLQQATNSRNNLNRNVRALKDEKKMLRDKKNAIFWKQSVNNTIFIVVQTKFNKIRK